MYISENEYIQITGADTAPSNFTTLEQYASSLVNALCLYQIGDSPPEEIADRVKAATAYQVQYIDAQGGISCINDARYSGATIGKFSYSGPSSNDTSILSLDTSPLISMYIVFINAWYRGCNL